MTTYTVLISGEEVLANARELKALKAKGIAFTIIAEDDLELDQRESDLNDRLFVEAYVRSHS